MRVVTGAAPRAGGARPRHRRPRRGADLRRRPAPAGNARDARRLERPACARRSSSSASRYSATRRSPPRSWPRATRWASTATVTATSCGWRRGQVREDLVRAEAAIVVGDRRGAAPVPAALRGPDRRGPRPSRAAAAGSRCCGRAGATTGARGRRRRASHREATADLAAARSSCCTTPTTTRRPARGSARWRRCRGHRRGDRPRRPGRGVAMTGVHRLVVASLTGQLTSWIGHHGAYAVFAIMALDALLPVGGELTMLYAGALAAGAITGQHPVLLGHPLQTGLESYLVLADRRHPRLPAGLADRLGDRPLGRARAARAPRALAARDAREPRARRALVRSPRPRGGLPRAPDAGRALLHLDPGRRAGEPARPVHAAHARRLGHLVLRLRRRRVGAGLQLRVGPSRLPLRRRAGGGRRRWRRWPRVLVLPATARAPRDGPGRRRRGRRDAGGRWR